MKVSVSAETVEKAEQYLARADEQLRIAANELTIPSTSVSSTSTSFNPMENLRNNLNEFGPELAPLLQTVFDETVASNPISRELQPKQESLMPPDQPLDNLLTNVSISDDGQVSSHIDMALWEFLFQTKEDSEIDVN
ncbi:unnamed protein product [Trichobilharzia regenti]|nr:unnamed protein product [Trichobilharzia regenti]